MEQLDVIMESDSEMTEAIVIDTTKKDGVGDILRVKRTPRRVLACMTNPKEFAGKSKSKTKSQGQVTHHQVEGAPQHNIYKAKPGSKTMNENKDMS